MKVKDVMIIILAGALIVMMILYSQKKPESTTDQVSYIEVSDGLYIKESEEFTSEGGFGLFTDDRFDTEKILETCEYTPVPSDGKSTTNVVAVRNVINTFEQNRGGNVEIMAYHIGLEQIENIYNQAIGYNDTVSNESDSIVGYRFYHCTTSRHFGVGTPQEWPVRDKKDIIAVPTLNSGEDYYAIYNNNGKHSSAHILEMFYHFRPCPKVCGSGSEKDSLGGN